jgi:hypothetical protein
MAGLTLCERSKYIREKQIKIYMSYYKRSSENISLKFQARIRADLIASTSQ